MVKSFFFKLDTWLLGWVDFISGVVFRKTNLSCYQQAKVLLVGDFVYLLVFSFFYGKDVFSHFILLIPWVVALSLCFSVAQEGDSCEGSGQKKGKDSSFFLRMIVLTMEILLWCIPFQHKALTSIFVFIFLVVLYLIDCTTPPKKKEKRVSPRISLVNKT